MKKYKVGIIGATGMVGQRFTLLLENHPWFEVTVLAASKRSAGKTYGETVEGRWHMTAPLPEKYKDMVIVDAENVEEVASQVDFCFCAVNMKKDEIRDLEDRYAKAECPIVSNNSAHRFTDDVPMVIPEINADHIKIIDAQRKRLGTKRGFVAVKSNCSLQSYVPAIHPLKALGVDKVLACTYQAISGAGKTFKTWPEMVDNVIPYIGGEEEKSEQEPLKIWGKIEGDKIVKTDDISITSQCIRVPVSDGHTAAVFMSFKDGVKKPTNILARVGTKISDLIKMADGFNGSPKAIVAGGPMTGYSQFDGTTPVQKNTSGLIVLHKDTATEYEVSPCIRCAKCVHACPVHLMPLNIAAYALAGRFEDTAKYHANACIACGSCSYICPAHRPLTELVTASKRELRASAKRAR